jgi:hypothetical protein
MRNIEELKMSLKLYKESLGEERLKVKEDKRQPVEIGQVRVLFWMPNEYVLIYHIEDEGLVHAVPLTVWVSLTTCSLRLHIKDRIFAPLPFVLCILEKRLLEQESYPIAVVRQETIEKVLRAVDRSPTWFAIKPKREFLKLVWKRYEDITLSSLFYTHIRREKQEEATKGLVIQLLPYVVQKYISPTASLPTRSTDKGTKGQKLVWRGGGKKGCNILTGRV